MMEIKKAVVNEAGLLAKLAIKMWDDNSVDGLEADFVNYMNNGGAVFMAWNDVSRAKKQEKSPRKSDFMICRGQRSRKRAREKANL